MGTSRDLVVSDRYESIPTMLYYNNSRTWKDSNKTHSTITATLFLLADTDSLTPSARSLGVLATHSQILRTSDSTRQTDKQQKKKNKSPKCRGRGDEGVVRMNVEHHDEHESSSISPNPHEVYYRDRWQGVASICHRQYPFVD